MQKIYASRLGYYEVRIPEDPTLDSLAVAVLPQALASSHAAHHPLSHAMPPPFMGSHDVTPPAGQLLATVTDEYNAAQNAYLRNPHPLVSAQRVYLSIVLSHI